MADTDSPETEVREQVMVQYQTENSVYEVDHTGPVFRVRRLTGRFEPTPNTGTNGVWKDADKILVTDGFPGRCLYIEWTGGGSTMTSPVVAVLPVAPATREPARHAALCAHCGGIAQGYATVGRERLCHPDEGLDCYRLVTVYGEPIGARQDGNVPEKEPLSPAAIAAAIVGILAER